MYTNEDIILIDDLVTANGWSSHHIAWNEIKKYLVEIERLRNLPEARKWSLFSIHSNLTNSEKSV
jgi:hypothetical protein